MRRDKDARQAAPGFFDRLKDAGRIGKGVVTRMGKGEVPHPELAQEPDD
jgi:hypothetical protein